MLHAAARCNNHCTDIRLALWPLWPSPLICHHSLFIIDQSAVKNSSNISNQISAADTWLVPFENRGNCGFWLVLERSNSSFTVLDKCYNAREFKCFPFFLDSFSHLYKRVCPSVGRSVRPSVRRSHTSWNLEKVPFLTKTTSTSENASYAVYPALFSFLFSLFLSLLWIPLSFVLHSFRCFNLFRCIPESL